MERARRIYAGAYAQQGHIVAEATAHLRELERLMYINIAVLKETTAARTTRSAATEGFSAPWRNKQCREFANATFAATTNKNPTSRKKDKVMKMKNSVISNALRLRKVTL